MNKNKLSLSLVSSLIAAMAMTACSKTVTSDKNAVVTFKGYDGEQVVVLTNDVYYNYLKNASGIGKFYDAMLEVLVRYEFQNKNSVLNNEELKPTRTYAEIEKSVDTEIEGVKNDAKEAAKTNGTTYDKQWQKYLDEQGVENVKELKQKFIYREEKEEVEDWYFRANEDALLTEYIGVNAEGQSSQTIAHSSFPYHIRHILTNVSSGSTDYYNGTISEQEASNLYTVVKALRDGKDTFGQVAHEQSGDSGSAEKYGSVGIMDIKTSFVNEFKLGIYAFDAIYSRTDATSNAVINQGLGLSANNNMVKDQLEAIGLTYVPVGVFDQLNAFKDKDKDDLGHQVNENNANYYPRNVYWNKYLNHHNIFVITNNNTNPNDVQGTPVDDSIDARFNEDAQAGRTGFRYVEGISKNANQRILTDEKGRVIVCVRSDHGIHFMVIEKSVFEYDTLSDYYDTEVPTKFEDVNPDNYVGYLTTTDMSKYKERANEIKSAVKAFDSTYDYRLYEYFLTQEGDKIEFASNDKGLDLTSAVAKYVNSQREYNLWNADKTLAESWRTYLELIAIQYANRVEERLIPEMCALRYAENPQTDVYGDGYHYGEGGKCHYVK